jgi:photosystem II stability/assembly factor-like uncharacterized protein
MTGLFKSSALGIGWLGLAWLLGAGQPVRAQTGHWGQIDLGTTDDLLDVMFVDADHGWIVGQNGLILRTTNGGDNAADWLAPSVNPTAATLRKVFFLDATTGWVVGDNGVVIQTTDGGDTWDDSIAIGQSKVLTSVYFVDASNGWVTTTTPPFTGYFTNNGGSGWSVFSPDVGVQGLDIVFRDLLNGWVVTQGGGCSYSTYDTTDGGAAWGPVVCGGNLLRAIGLNAAGVVWAVGDAGVMRTSSDGFGVEVFFGATTFRDVSFAPGNANLAWVVGDSGVIRRTDDAGAAWNLETNPVASQLTAVSAFSEQRAWAVGPGGVYLVYRECIIDGQCAGGVVGCVDTGACDPLSHVCGTQLPNGTDCDDGDPCNGTGSCQTGLCSISAPLPDGTGCGAGSLCCGQVCRLGDCCTVADCDDFNTCTDDSCQGFTCLNAPNAAACDDGQYCTVGDVCAGGSCQPGGARDCSFLDNACNLGTCDEAGDTCQATANNEGQPCDDGLFCTLGEVCQAGTCANPSPRDCSGAGDQCNLGVCDDGLDQCVGQALADGSACEDGQFCSVGDTCQSGNCLTGSARDCSGFGDQCNLGVCDEAADQCDMQPLANGTGCDDADACTMTDVCTDGNCEGVALDLDGDGYVDLVCGGTDCADGDPAINPGVFEGPAGDPLCADGIDNDCDALTDLAEVTCGNCNVDADCSDADVCNGLETCAGGVCQAGTPLVCDDGNDCTSDGCDPVAGCSSVQDPDGSACGQRYCAGLDRFQPTCQAGSCAGVQLLANCADSNPCTDDACDPNLGCSHANNLSPCDDSDLCTESDVCSAGVCRGSQLDCSGLDDDCHLGGCEAASGSCIARPANDGLVCDDGLVCTQAGTSSCATGACVGGAPLDCSGLDGPCSLGQCAEPAGCFAQGLPDDSPCDDGSLCSTGDRCLAGECVGTSVRDCSFLDQLPCLIGWCDPDLDDCFQVPANEGAGCDNSEPCDQQDVCVLGECRGQPICGPCQRCEPGTGQCQPAPETDHDGCVDPDACTGSCDGATGICVVEAWCQATPPGCDQQPIVEYAAGVDCRLPADAIELAASVGMLRTGQRALIPVRIQLANRWEPGLRSLVLRIQPSGSARFVLGSAVVQAAGVSLDEIAGRDGAAAYLRLTTAAPALFAEAGRMAHLDFALAGSVETGAFAVDVWAECQAALDAPGCHLGFGGADRVDLAAAWSDSTNPDLQRVSATTRLRLSGEQIEERELEQLQNLVLGCACSSTPGSGLSLWLVLMVLGMGIRRGSRWR